MQDRKVAITHANSLLAEAILEKLPESSLAPDSIVLLDNDTQAGNKLAYCGTHLEVQDQLEYDYSDCALVLMLQFEQGISDKVLNLDTILLGHTLDTDDQPVFASHMEAELNISYTQKSVKLVSAELACLLGVLPALHQKFPISHINSVFMRSAEAKDKAGVNELASQTIALLNSQEVKPELYPQQIAFNLLPVASSPEFNEDLARILGSSTIRSVHQMIDVPIFHGLSAAIQLSFDSEVTLNACNRIFQANQGVRLKSTQSSPISDCNQTFSCVINRLEQAQNQPHTLQFWMIADPIRYGLANNYVNATEILLKSFL